MKRVLVLGVAGMAGHVIYNRLKLNSAFEVTGVTRTLKIDASNIILDISDFHALEKLVNEWRPDFIVNAVGVLIQGAKASASNAILLNAYLPHYLSEIGKKYNSKLIHISTDCVFSGNQGDYVENSFRDADDVYGRSKALGEIANEKDLTIRTSIIGPELKDNGEGLFHWFYNVSGDIKGFTKAFWSGVTTFELAVAIEEVLFKDINGLIHLTNNQKISKYDLLMLFKEIWHKDDVTIHKDDRVAKDKSLIDTKSVLIRKVPGYRDMLVNMKSLMDKDSIYNQYKAAHE